MNKLEKQIFNSHRLYFASMFMSRTFSFERRLQFGDNAHRAMLMFGSAENGIVATHPPRCFGIAP